MSSAIHSTAVPGPGHVGGLAITPVQLPVLNPVPLASYHVSRHVRASSSRKYEKSMQSIDAVLYAVEAHRQQVLSKSISTLSAKQLSQGVTNEPMDQSDNANEDCDEFGEFDRLIEAYEQACTNCDLKSIMLLPLPVDPDDVWSEIEDAVIRSFQWDSLLNLMRKFDKQFDTDFVGEIITSNYEDEHKICIVELALHAGWDINSPKSDGGYILCDAIENETDTTLGCLLHHGANPNLYLTDIILDPDNPLTTSIGLPLQDALEFGSFQQSHLLLSHGADPNLANGIHTAIRSDDHEAWKLKLLLSFGADKNAHEWAGNAVMTSLLQERTGVECVTPVALAYKLGKAHVVQFLLDTSVDPDATVLPRGKMGTGLRRERKDRLRLRKERVAKARLLGKGKAKGKVMGGLALGMAGRRSGDFAGAGKSHGVGRSVRARHGVRMMHGSD